MTGLKEHQAISPDRTAVMKILVGAHADEKAYLTWCDGINHRVTPIDGDPLVSLEFKSSELRFSHWKNNK